MLRPRIIPCLLVKNKGLVKTVKFGSPKYVGDPINAVRIFNEKEVDELIVVDIDASIHKREPDYTLIRNLAAECRMPLCYGGGVKTVEQIQEIISLGVEKVAISSAALDTPDLVSEAAAKVGCQSIVVVMDVKKSGLLRRYELFTLNGFTKSGANPAEFVDEMRIEAATQWYAQQRISQEKGAEIAGISRAEFIDELARRRIPIIQVGFKELMDEVRRD